VFPDANWPQEALEIIKNAGPEPAFDALHKKLPGVVFDSKVRYTVRPLTH
jgi:hypothetical protein